MRPGYCVGMGKNLSDGTLCHIYTYTVARSGQVMCTVDIQLYIQVWQVCVVSSANSRFS